MHRTLLMSISCQSDTILELQIAFQWKQLEGKWRKSKQTSRNMKDWTSKVTYHRLTGELINGQAVLEI